MVKYVILMLALAAAVAVAAVVLMLRLGEKPSTEIAAPSAPSISPAIVTPRLGLDNLKRIQPPQPAPEGSFQDASGKALRLADFRGRSVLLNFWATWCAPCVEEMPMLDALQGELGGPGFVVVPVSVDRKGLEEVKPFYERLGLKQLGIYLDPQAKLSEAAKVQALPATLLLDRDGKVVVSGEGAVKWDAPEVKAFVREQIKQP